VFHAPYLKQLEIPDHSEVMAQPNLGKANSYTTEVWHSDLSFMPALRRILFWRRRCYRRRVATPCLPASTRRTKRYLRV
jgi:hypothetical protein